MNEHFYIILGTWKVGNGLVSQTGSGAYNYIDLQLSTGIITT